MASETRSNDSASPAPRPFRRRMRMINSCFECRRRKQKCSKDQPCEKCIDFGRECIYLSRELDDAGKQRFNDMKNKVGSLERALERNIALTSAASKPPADLVIDSVGYEEGYEVQVQPGDMLTSETIANMHQDESCADLVDAVLRMDRVHLHVRTEALMLARFTSDNLHPKDLKGLIAAASERSKLPGFMQFSADCIMPFSGQILSPSSENATLKTWLPSRDEADRLVTRYFRSVHLLCPCLDQCDFDRTYNTFWDNINQSIEPSPRAYCWVFAVLFAAAVSLSKTVYPLDMGKYPDTSDVQRYKTAIEIALCRSEFLRGTSFAVFQAYVVYLLAIVRTEISRAHSISIGTALRIAECMGLGKDGEYFNLTPMEIQLRRLVWYQLCFMDIRTSEAQGPRPYLRRDDFNTKLPVNIENEYLANADVMPKSTERWTPMTLSLIRFEINEVARAIWADRQKPETRRATITEMLSRVDEFWKQIVSKYDHLMDLSIPSQKYTRLAYHLQMYRLYVLVLMRYNTHHSIGLPAKLNSVLVRACIMICELTMQLDTDEMFAEWKWYFGAYTQYQPALVLAREIYDNPNSSEADRIWVCLDHCFVTSPSDSRERKIELIMSGIVTKLHIYRTLRMPAWTTRSRQAQMQNGRGKKDKENESHGTTPQKSSSQQDSQTPVPVLGSNPGPQLLDNRTPGVYSSSMPSSMSRVARSDTPGTEIWQQPAAPSFFQHPLSEPRPNALTSEPAALMDIDWDTINNIFQQDPNTGELILVGYRDMSLSTSLHS
ncbi:uncharacterized protein BROUX77_000720 [Berkeleyomyces rouxiae]|uniref:uncharacterized protein n=1 Tax=Berkeleyomyces rouxiae TaxID=2035830 RepID=UPI003B78BAF1